MFICKSVSQFIVKRRLTNLAASSVVHEIQKHKQDYGFNTETFKFLKPKKIIVEFSSPNIAKIFHAGHFRSTIIGNVISNLLKKAGHDVYKINYLGDWGFQFALLAAGFEKYGDNENLENISLDHLYEVYIKTSQSVTPELRDNAQDIFLKMEQADENTLKFWEACRNESLKEFKRIYQLLGVNFDEYSGESKFHSNVKEKVISKLEERGLLHRMEDQAINVDLFGSSWITQKGNTKPIILKKNGTSLYLTRDAVSAMERYKTHQFDQMIYVTDFSQGLHFQQLFSILGKLGCEWAEKDKNILIHKTFGRILKMQSRTGNSVAFIRIFNELVELIQRDRLKHSTRKSVSDNEVARTLALTSMVCLDLKSSLRKDYKFTWDAVLAWKGNSGIFLQYTHCRLCSLERNCGISININANIDLINQQTDLIAMLELLSEYKNIIESAVDTLEPCVIVQYLFKLSHSVAKALRTNQVKNEQIDKAEAILLCFTSARQVLGNGLTILGVTPLEKM